MNQYYNILGLSPGASEADIKKAYKKLAIRYHPDKNKDPGAIENFKQISEAYQILTNPDEHVPQDPFPGQSFHSHRNPFPGNFRGFMNADDLFRQFFQPHFSATAQPFTTFHVFDHQNKNVHNFVSQTNISVQNGKRVETKIETRNGETKKTTKIYDANTSQLLEETVHCERISN